MKHKKFSIVQIIRHVIQLMAFIVLPGLFISIFSGMKAIYVSVLKGGFHLTELLGPLVLIGSVLLITLIWGRFFCGFLCSFGAMGDLIYSVSSRFLKKKRRVSESLDTALKYVKYVILILIVTLGWTLDLTLDSSYSPWTVFGLYASIESWTVPEHLLSVGALLLLLIIAASIFIERFFCRYLCPLGAIFALISRARLYRIKRGEESCGKCRLCTAKCSMGVSWKGLR